MSTHATNRVLALPLLGVEYAPSRETPESPAARFRSDEELLEAVRERHEESLLLLFRRYNLLAFFIGCRILRDKGEAEDMVQDVFLRLYSGKHTFDASKGSARTWIVQMIYRRAFDRRSYLARRHFYTSVDSHETTKVHVVDRNLEHDIVEHLSAQQLRKAFDDLSGNQKKTLELYFFEGLNLSEIAERLREDVGNIRHHYYRGLERLRKLARESVPGKQSHS